MKSNILNKFLMLIILIITINIISPNFYINLIILFEKYTCSLNILSAKKCLNLNLLQKYETNYLKNLAYEKIDNEITEELTLISKACTLTKKCIINKEEENKYITNKMNCIKNKSCIYDLIDFNYNHFNLYSIEFLNDLKNDLVCKKTVKKYQIKDKVCDEFNFLEEDKNKLFSLKNSLFWQKNEY